MKAQQQKAYSGQLTQGAKKRLTKAIDLLCQSIKPQTFYSPVAMKTICHKLSFITLTISSKKNVTAKEAYHKGLKHFIQWLRRTMKVTTYVWKAEVQKRGQIHYHITTPSYIHFQQIKDKWNNIQHHAGWLKDYYEEHKHYNPNSTDIHGVRHVKNLSSYLLKEFIKTIQNPKTEGKIWDCSLNLKKYKYHTIYESREKNQQISDMIEAETIEVIPTDHCIIVKPKKASTTEILDLQQMQKYNEFLAAIRNYKKER